MHFTNYMVRHVLYLAPQAELTRRTGTVSTIRFIDAGDFTAKLDEYGTVNLSSVNATNGANSYVNFTR